MNNEITLKGLTNMAIEPLLVSLRKAWLRVVIGHYDMSADVELDAARIANKHAADFQKRAAMARSELRMLTGVPTERRGSRIKRVLFGIMRRSK